MSSAATTCQEQLSTNILAHAHLSHSIVKTRLVKKPLYSKEICSRLNSQYSIAFSRTKLLQAKCGNVWFSLQVAMAIHLVMSPTLMFEVFNSVITFIEWLKDVRYDATRTCGCVPYCSTYPVIRTEEYVTTFSFPK